MSTKPKPSPISAILDLPDDAIIYCTIGTLEKVHQRKHGTIGRGPNTGKPWSIQNLTLRDGTGTIEVSLKDRADEIPKSWQGREIMLEAYNGEKGWSGVKSWDDDYDNKITRRIKVTPTGTISLVEGGERPPTTPPPAGQQQQQQRPPATTQQQQPAGRKAQEHGRETYVEPEPGYQEAKTETHEQAAARKQKEAQRMAIQISNLQQLCLSTVEHYTAPRFEAVSKRALTPEEKHSWAMNMNIEMCKNGGWRLMPTHKLATPKPDQATTSAKADTTTEREAPSGWPAGAIPHPQTGEPMDPKTGELLF